MDTKTKITGIFILLAIADLGSFTLLTNLKKGLDGFELNIVYRLLGYFPMLLIYIIIHALIIYYFYKPCFRGRDINYEFAVFMVLICLGHTIGTYSNIVSYMTYIPPKVVGNTVIAGTPVPTSEELTYGAMMLGIGAMIVLYIMTCPSKIYFAMDDEFKFDKIKENDVLKKKYKWYYVLDESLKLGFNVVIYLIIGAFVSIYVDKYFHLGFSTKRLFELLFILIAMYRWVNKIVRGKNVN